MTTPAVNRAAGLDTAEQMLCRDIAARGEALYADLERYVAIPTGAAFTPGLDELRGMLAERLQELGAVITEHAGDERPVWLTLPSERGIASPKAPLASAPPTIIASRCGLTPHASGPRVLLAGHIDTVHDPVGTFQRLTRESDTIARGPGAADMKGGITLALHALEALMQRADVSNSLRWSFLLNSDEETGSFHSARHIEDAGRLHDVGIALEPASDNGGLVVARMGSGHFRIDCTGRTAHAGRDFIKGVSAVNALAQAILDAAAASAPDAGRIVNIGPLEGGLVSNAVPDHASAWGNVRFADPKAQVELARRLDSLNTTGDTLPGVMLRRTFARAAKPMTPEVERFAMAVRDVATDLGQPLPFTTTGGVCDGNVLQSVGLLTLDTLGIRGGNLHRTDEFIEIPSLVERCQLLAIVLYRIGTGRITIL
ncbi:MAG: M20/M25/M40 family metallo-hydrolase [Phycisphaerae bacterium]|nr:M20/M25/M40 family metallo-hydrolase [Phycisphaerae bacterium]